MANVLEFAIGITGLGEFINASETMRRGIEGVAIAAELSDKGFERMWESINQGAELRGLASATGESVDMLYRFQQGLQGVGGAFNPMMFLQVQKALSGINDQGLRTDILFSKIGLDIGKLRSEDGVKSITDIATALNKLNPTQAAGVAEQIFGRFQAEQILQIARNMETFNRGFTESSGTGALLEKFSKTFEDVVQDWQLIRNDVDGIWVSVAGALAPEMHKIFTEVHDDIKNIGPALAEAMRTGQMGELFKEAFAAAWEDFKNYGEASAAAVIVFMGDTLSQVLVTVFTDAISVLYTGIKNGADIAYRQSLVATDQQNIDNSSKLLGKIDTMPESDFAHGKEINGQNFRSKTDAQMFFQGQADAAQSDINEQQQKIAALSGQTVSSIHDHMVDAMTKSAGAIATGVHDGMTVYNNILAAAAHTSQDRLKAMVANLAKDFVTGANASNSGSGGDGNLITGLESHYKPEFTSLEKMGFVMSGSKVQNPMEQRKVDLLQTIANNTSPQHEGQTSPIFNKLVSQP